MTTNDNTTQAAREAEAERITAYPAVASNIARHVMALELLLCGRPGSERRDGEPIIGGGLALNEGERKTLVRASLTLGADHVHLAFDRGNAMRAPISIDVIRSEGERIVTYPSCGLWAPANDGRLVIVARHQGLEPQRFTFRQGSGLIRRAGSADKELMAGFQRAGTRLARLAASDALRTVHRQARRSIIESFGGGDFLVSNEHLAA